MVNWKDQEVIVLCARAASIVLHCCAAIWLYEFFITIGHDIEILRGKRKFNLGTALYLICRYLTTIAHVLDLRALNAMDASVNCFAWEQATLSFAFAAVSCTSGLLYIRAMAVSRRNKYVVWGLGLGYAVIWAFVGIAINKTTVLYLPAPLYICAPIGLRRYRDNMSYPFSYDMICLGVMMFFLLRERHGGQLWKFLVQQGVAYACGICFAYLFVIILVSLDLNDAMSDIGFGVILTISTICATRMQRDLSEFYERPDGNAQNSSRTYPPKVSASHHQYTREQTINGGVQVTVDMDIREDSVHNEWKNPRSFVPDDYEMGKVDAPPPLARHPTWEQPRGGR